MKKKLIVTIAVLAVGYLAVYPVLSHDGEYQPSMSGEVRYKYSGLAVMDIWVWSPALLRFQVYKNVEGKSKLKEANTLGMVYSPLIAIDRTFWHKTSSVLENPELSEMLGPIVYQQ